MKKDFCISFPFLINTNEEVKISSIQIKPDYFSSDNVI